MRDYREVNRDLRALLQNATVLPRRDVESVECLIVAGEWELALDTLCTQLDTHEIKPSNMDQEKILRLGEELGVEVRELLSFSE